MPSDPGECVAIYHTMWCLCIRKLKPNGHPLYSVYQVTLLKGEQQECSSGQGFSINPFRERSRKPDLDLK